MARFGNFFVMLSLILASADAADESLSPGTGDDSDYDAYPPIVYPPLPANDDPSFDDPEVPPVPSPGYYKHLEECAKQMTPVCADEIFGGMFYTNSRPLTESCCRILVHMGYECHNGLVKQLLLKPVLKEKALIALPKSLQIWNKCVSVVYADSPAPAAI